MARHRTSERLIQTLSDRPIPKPLSRLFFPLPQFPPSMMLATLLNIALGEAGLTAIPPELKDDNCV